MLTIEEAMKMIKGMHDTAREDEHQADRDGDQSQEDYWSGFADALWTLQRHIETDVKVSCFPVGTCKCHPFFLERQEKHPFWINWRKWWNRAAGC